MAKNETTEMREARLKRRRARYAENREKISETRKAHYQANKEKIIGQKRSWALINKYGITPRQYDTMSGNQLGKCAICGKTQNEEMESEGRRLAVDHDHATGRVRGLLCKGCNVGIGHLGDSIGTLRAAIAYLEACEPPF